MIQLADNLGYQGPKPNFARDYYSTKARLKEVTDHDIDDGHISYCAETGLHYEYKYNNSEDDTYGKWREYKPLDIELSETSENGVQNKVLNSIIKDLKTKYESVKTDLDNVTDLVQMDEELNDESTRGVQNKVLKKMFDTIGTQIATLENNIKESLSGSFLKAGDVIQTEQKSVEEGQNDLSLPDLEFTVIHDQIGFIKSNVITENYPYDLEIDVQDEGDGFYKIELFFNGGQNIYIKKEGEDIEDVFKVEGEIATEGEFSMEFDEAGKYLIINAQIEPSLEFDKEYKFTISNLIAENGKPVSKSYLDNTIVPEISNITAQLDNFRKYHLTDAEIEAIYKETRGGILDDISKTRFDEVYEWYKSIVRGNESTPGEGGVDYTSIAERVQNIEDELPVIKSDASAAKSNTLQLSSKLDSWTVNDNQTYGLKNGKIEILVGANEQNVVTDYPTAYSLAIQSLNLGELVLTGADDEMINEIRNLLGDKYFDDLASNSVQTMALQPQLTPEDLLNQAKAEYDLRKEEEKKVEMKDSNEDLLETQEEIEGKISLEKPKE